MKMLFNGCSWSYGYELVDYEKERFSYLIDPSAVNIAQPGASNDLICRETIKWIIENGNPDYVVVQWTFVDRREILLDNKDRTLYLNPVMVESSKEVRFQGMEWSVYQPLAKAYYEKVHSTKGSWSNYFKNMFLLQEFLENRNIQYEFFRVQPMDIIQRKSIEPWKKLCKNPYPQNFLDVLGGFRKSGSHPNAEGHRKIAEVIKNTCFH